MVFDSMPGRTCQNEISNNRLLVRISHALPFVFHFSTAIHVRDRPTDHPSLRESPPQALRGWIIARPRDLEIQFTIHDPTNLIGYSSRCPRSWNGSIESRSGDTGRSLVKSVHHGNRFPETEPRSTLVPRTDLTPK